MEVDDVMAILRSCISKFSAFHAYKGLCYHNNRYNINFDPLVWIKIHETFRNNLHNTLMDLLRGLHEI